ncbi:hypothetical protein C8R44DRAFT_737064 [Mycena epipterygia]|nr:hypothetical protein C8R44DRAFT_737064 [Mycena epipterygia]
MSMSQTGTQINESIALGPSSDAKEFPAAWFAHADDEYVIDRAHWNTEATPAHKQLKAHYSVNWNKFCGAYLLRRRAYDIEIAGLVVRHYFGVLGCIIPVGFIPEIVSSIFAFTLAGPCDSDGRMEFYILSYETGWDTAFLQRYSPGFSNVAAFHLHCASIKSTAVPPVEGGEREIVALFEKFGVCKKHGCRFLKTTLQKVTMGLLWEIPPGKIRPVRKLRGYRVLRLRKGPSAWSSGIQIKSAKISINDWGDSSG